MNFKINGLRFTPKQANVLSWVFVAAGLVLIYLNASHILRVRLNVVMLAVGLVDLCHAFVAWHTNRRVAVSMLCLATLMILPAVVFFFI